MLSAEFVNRRLTSVHGPFTSGDVDTLDQADWRALRALLRMVALVAHTEDLSPADKVAKLQEAKRVLRNELELALEEAIEAAEEDERTPHC